jgi:hypothetical protein
MLASQAICAVAIRSRFESGKPFVLGQELETYRGGRTATVLVGLLALAAAAVVVLAATSAHRDNTAIFLSLVLFAFPAAWFAWFRSLRVTLYSKGITYHTIFGDTEMLWEKVERFRYRAAIQRAHGVRIGISYGFRLRDSDGTKIRIGGRVDRPAQLGQRLIDLTAPALQQKILKRFDDDQDLDFGVIKLNRKTGIVIRRFLYTRMIPWDQFTGFAMEKGRIYIWRTGQKRTTGSPVHKVLNPFTLLTLLKCIYPAKELRV